MICGLCAVGRHGECTGLLRATLGFCRCADRDHAPAPATVMPASQPCEFCDRTAWHLSAQDWEDGTRVYACAAGHVAIVAAPANNALVSVRGIPPQGVSQL